jgi:hypothetical protein
MMQAWLSNTLSKMGSLIEAAEMEKGVLASSIKVFGEGHPNALNALSCLASTRARQGFYDEVRSRDACGVRAAGISYLGISCLSCRCNTLL